MKKIAIMLFGPPGSGKGTQANLLASKFNLIHFDSGKFLESVVHDQVRQKEAIIRRERELFDAGKLNSPSFVFREIAHRAEKFAESDLGIVFSGSPRTMHEAEKLVPLLKEASAKWERTDYRIWSEDAKTIHGTAVRTEKVASRQLWQSAPTPVGKTIRDMKMLPLVRNRT